MSASGILTRVCIGTCTCAHVHMPYTTLKHIHLYYTHTHAQFNIMF